MEILFQSHHAQVSDRMRERARTAVTKLGARLARAVNAVVRFESDGPTRRVEIVLHAPRRRAMVAEGFRVNLTEWWHFDHSSWRSYAITNVPFDRIAP